jgi:hypothetical protein
VQWSRDSIQVLQRLLRCERHTEEPAEPVRSDLFRQILDIWAEALPQIGHLMLHQLH